MKEIGEQHLIESGLVVLDITAADDETARRVVAELSQRWATSGVLRRTPGLPGVSARVYADIRRTGAEAP
ncbi:MULTISPECIES: DUF6207 family protein [Streptomyces]|uniref:DUF6207 family protein n=1 Tax=Streptomyces TaxID=1883 RepID=UPI0005BA5D75|nr:MULTISPECIES: DUF6207 family protein [Streptomyces]MDP9954319.1 putative DNA-binding ArsR family transcriptional regulator [Streptomyces sp. DSM 41269]